jgi:integrase
MSATTLAQFPAKPEPPANARSSRGPLQATIPSDQGIGTGAAAPRQDGPAGSLVFASTISTPIEPRNINRRWDELRERAGLDWLRLHDLRHGCATFMLAAGVPSRAIMEVLGHSGISVTMNTYAHVLPALRQEAADAIDEVFGAP